MALNIGEFGEAVQTQVNGVIGLQVRVEWDLSIRRSGDLELTPVSQSEEIRVDPSTGIEWRMRLLRQDTNSFEPGAYEINLSLADALRSVRDVEGRSWSGRAVQETTLHLDIVLPATPLQSAAMYRHYGNNALAETRDDEAVKWFSQALEANPTDVASVVGLGQAYLRQNRYREAIVAFERALPAERERSHTPQLLALAYVAVGDEANARRVLRSRGKSESEISEQINSLRQLAQRRSRR